MIFGGRVAACATKLAENWNRSSFLLGYVSVQTTERYLRCKQRLRNVVNDKIGLGGC
jgi:hypothetical protein